MIGLGRNVGAAIRATIADMNDKSPSIADKPPRERILLTAHDLFYRDGIRATGIDKVIAESGVTKVTFYRQFPSKNDLILAFLNYRHQRWMAWFEDALARHGGRDGGGLAPVSLALAEWFDNPLFRGCAFINSVAELGGAMPDVVAICRDHKQDMERVIARLLPDGPMRGRLAEAAAIAVDGAIIRAQAEPNRPDDEAARRAALRGLETLLTALSAAGLAGVEAAPD